MKYKLIKSSSMGSLQKQVNDWLAVGWKATGGLIYDGNIYAQAIVIEIRDN